VKKSFPIARIPRVVIVGGGFGGLSAAKGLAGAACEITLIDRHNYHLFQPLLYQVATAGLSPADIAAPIRGIVGAQRNITVALAAVSGVDTVRSEVIAEGRRISFDFLVLATGAQHAYFGRDDWAFYAPGLKTIDDATYLRRRILLAFERAEAEPDPIERQRLLNFVIVGGGPTGVEMAGAIGTLVRNTVRSEFRRIDPSLARIVLIDRSPRVLGSFSEDLSSAAKDRLKALGVEVLLGRSVEHIDRAGVIVAGERILSNTVIWTAGVSPSPAARWLSAESDHAGRVCVQHDLSVPGHPEIFVVGDTARLDQDGKPLPGVAQVAMQQGRYASRLIALRLAGQPAPPPFRYFDKGNMAVVGKGFAVLESGRLRVSGFPAWLAWAAVHLEFLGQSNLRVSVFLQWVWTYLTGQGGSWLIVNHHGTAPVSTPEAPDLVHLDR